MGQIEAGSGSGGSCNCDDSGTNPNSIGILVYSELSIEGMKEFGFAKEEGGRVSRGQHIKECPTKPIGLHANFTGGKINVSGEMKVDANSCPVLLIWDAGPRGRTVLGPGTNIPITVPLEAGTVLTGQCVKGHPNNLCSWSFTPTSP